MLDEHPPMVLATKKAGIVGIALACLLGLPMPASAQVGAPPKPKIRQGKTPPQPVEHVTITWDERFKQVPTKVAVVKNVAILEGDIAIGTIVDVKKAQLNELTRRASRLKASGALTDPTLGLPPSAVQLIQAVADLPADPTNLRNASPFRTDAVRLLQDIERFGIHQSSKPLTAGGAEAAPIVPSSAVNFPTADFQKFRVDVLPRKPPGAPEAAPQGVGSLELASGLPRNSPYLWPNGVIPYFIEPDFSDDYVAMIKAAMGLWENRWPVGQAKVHFRPYQAGDQHWIQFRYAPGLAGNSLVGMKSPVGYGQVINLPDDFPTPNIAHEVGHSIGLFHEQSRSDRDNYLTIHKENVIQSTDPTVDYASQFDVTQDDNYNYETFDFGSIMLYNAWAFSFAPAGTPGAETMVSRYPDISGSEDQWGLNSSNIKGPSNADILTVEQMYPNPASLAPGPSASGLLAAPASTPDGNLFVGPPALGPAKPPKGAGPAASKSGVSPPLPPPTGPPGPSPPIAPPTPAGS